MTRAESIAMALTCSVAAAILGAYLPYRVGWTVRPTLVLVVAVVASIGMIVWLKRSAPLRGGPTLHAAGHRFSGAEDVIGFAMVVGVVVGWSLSIAWPGLLPIGGGPDLTHHMVLINHIERHWNLIVDASLVPYLGDMIFYTPGSHLLIALTGAWTGRDGLHAAQIVLAAAVALKAGFVFLIARRVLRDYAIDPAPFASVAVLLLFLPFQYVAGSFAENSFWPQVVSELFACAMWWALVVWEDRAAPVIFGVAGAAAFVTWPIWIGPPVVAIVAIGMFCLLRGTPEGAPYRRHAIALIPIAAAIVIHAAGRLQWLGMAGTSGAVIRPSPHTLTWPFIVLAIPGVALLTARRSGRSTAIFCAAIAVQAAALTVAAKARGADAPYLALKMMFLAIYPLAVGGAAALATVWTAAAARLPRREALAWTTAIALAVWIGHRVATTPRPAPIVTESAYLAGRWARDHVPPACVDYLVAEGYTAYWLHLAVLDNPRNTSRVEDPATFEPAKAFERWLYPNGLPYAIVDDTSRYAPSFFSGTKELVRFGKAAVIERSSSLSCTR